MELATAMLAVAPNGARDATEGLIAARPGLEGMSAFDNELRLAHMIGQCAHESLRFTARAESLFYTTASRLRAVFGSGRFPTEAAAAPFVRNPEKLANFVYADRIGNGPPASGDGFRYRGRGWLQLTGRGNYRTVGQRIGVDLETRPEKAEEAETAWLIAGSFLSRSKSDGRTAFEWADEDNVEKVTRIVNGRRMHGLAERGRLTVLALRALGGVEARPALATGAEGPSVRLLQRLLTERGFPLGAIDGDFGAKTENALKAFQAHAGLAATGRADAATWEALEPGSA